MNRYHTYSGRKAHLAERVIRTLRELLIKTMMMNNSLDWVRSISQVVYAYNCKLVHSSIGMTPIQAFNGGLKVEVKQVARVISGYDDNFKFQEGDRIVTKVKRDVFDKGFGPVFINDVYTVRVKAYVKT